MVYLSSLVKEIKIQVIFQYLLKARSGKDLIRKRVDFFRVVKRDFAG